MSAHVLTFAIAALVAWASGTFAFIWFQPRIFYWGVRRAILRGGGVKAGGIPVNTLYALPALNSPSMSKSALILTGNRDTLYTAGGLDLSEGPVLLHVPEMAERYYSVELFDSALGFFAVVGRRTTGTRSADFFVCGPGWSGDAPQGATKIAAPGDAVLVIGRVLVESEGDVSAAHELAKQIQVHTL